MEDFWVNVSPPDHILLLYEDDTEFFHVLSSYATAGLRAGESVIVVARPEKLVVLEHTLRQKGFNLFELGLRDQYIALDAYNTLEQFIIGDWPDPNLCHHLLANLLLRARKGNRPVRIYGEMVAILMEQGRTGASVFLEEWWNQKALDEEFTVFCAYPRSDFATTSVDCLARVCSCHSVLVAADGSSDLQVKEIAVRPGAG
jgi:hypothetical protein